MTPENDVLEGDCVEVMAGFDAESVDAIVCDPPYGLEFMGKGWDKLGAGTEVAFEATDVTHPFRDGSRRVRFGSSARSMQGWHEAWAIEALRVAKPGAHLLAFGGTRTYHRLACAIEDAGWEIRDCLVWAYASGFPKSLNFPDGWGTALKPAWEPIVMARKPLVGTVARNRDLHGTGALNIAATRIGFETVEGAGLDVNTHLRPSVRRTPSREPTSYQPGSSEERYAIPSGRWPANVLLTDPIFDGGVESVVGGGFQESTSVPGAWQPRGAFPIDNPEPRIYGDSGTYSRFFLVPKADRSDREPVLGGLPLVRGGAETMDPRVRDGSGADRMPMRRNVHPTVKPTELMRHLVRLVTPPGGLVLDPFLGSGTTALAAEMEGFRWLGIEREPEYVAIARARLLGTQRGLGLSA